MDLREIVPKVSMLIMKDFTYAENCLLFTYLFPASAMIPVMESFDSHWLLMLLTSR